MGYFNDMMEVVGAIGVQFEKIMPEIRIKALTDFPILILGETGTGKELVAKLIHKMSRRADNPLHFMNVPAINAGVFESELFGHKKGSFTNAIQARKGILRESEGGTVVLDEIGDMPHEAQVKILRWLENGEIKPVGSDKTEMIDVRIVASTNKNIEALVERGEFRMDLYYRLSSLNIQLSPLRKNIEVILDLAAYFIEKNREHFVDYYGKPVPDPTGSEIAEFFSKLVDANASCPKFLAGNARELEGVIRSWLFKRVYAFGQKRQEEIILSTHSKEHSIENSVEAPNSSEKVKEYSEEVIQNIHKALFFCKGNVRNASKLLECSEDIVLDLVEQYKIEISKEDFTNVSPRDIKSLKTIIKEDEWKWHNAIKCDFLKPTETDLEDIKKLLDEEIVRIEKLTIQHSIDFFNGNFSKVRKALGISKRKLMEKMKEYDLNELSGKTPTEVNDGPLKEMIRCVENDLIVFLLRNEMPIVNIATIFGWHTNTVYVKIRQYKLKD